MPDVHMRLVHYKRIANAGSERDLDELQIELIDRFGLLPAPAKTLFSITSLKLLAQRLGIAKIQAGPQGGTVRFGERSSVDPVVLLALIEDEGDSAIGSRVRSSCATRPERKRPQKRMAAVQALLAKLGAAASVALRAQAARTPARATTVRLATASEIATDAELRNG